MAQSGRTVELPLGVGAMGAGEAVSKMKRAIALGALTELDHALHLDSDHRLRVVAADLVHALDSDANFEAGFHRPMDGLLQDGRGANDLLGQGFVALRVMLGCGVTHGLFREMAWLLGS